MTFEVLMSCMHQSDMKIIKCSNLENVQTLVVNQCKTDKEEVKIDGKHRMINTATRGLSMSRNMAIKNANADICLLADDDEIFVDDLQCVVLAGYEKFPDADIIVYKLSNRYKKLGNKPRKLRKYEMLRVASWQISFRVTSIRDAITFDLLLGAGSGNGAGEENKFLLDAINAGLKIYYVPEIIGKAIDDSASTWFFGYDKNFFYNQGKTTRYTLGLFIANMYAIYTLIKQYPKYKSTISIFEATKALFRGVYDNELGKRKLNR